MFAATHIRPDYLFAFSVFEARIVYTYPHLKTPVSPGGRHGCLQADVY